MEKITTIKDLKVHLKLEIKIIEEKFQNWPELRPDLKAYNNGWVNAFKHLGEILDDKV